MGKLKLTINQRIVAVVIYSLIFITSCYLLDGFSFNFLLDTNNKFNLLFVSGALLLIFGSYITEPFFTKPVDIVTNSTSAILALLSINDSKSFILYDYIFWTSVGLLLLSIFVITTKDNQKLEKLNIIFYHTLTSLGQSKIIFSIIYILTIISYFRDNDIEFVFYLTFWVMLTSQFVVEAFIVFATKILNHIHDKTANDIVGIAIGCENPYLYKVEVDYYKHKIEEVKKGDTVYLSLNDNLGAVGIVINEKQLLNKKWITIYLLEDNNRPLKINLKTKKLVESGNTIFSKDNAVYTFDLYELEDKDKEKVTQNYLYKNRDKFIGYITDGSDINKIRFLSILDSSNTNYQKIREGAVIKSKIYNKETLFQIIDGRTNEEQLEKHDVHGFMIGIAQKLGYYNQHAHELEMVEWLPNIYSPVIFDELSSSNNDPLAIGVLPKTGFEIVIKDPNSLVTHNTAILGILGIGKSCLTFELIQKIIINTEAKVICIDITNEYIKGLSDYIDSNLISNDLEDSFNEINNKFDYIHKENETINYEKSGNLNLYKDEIEKDLNLFLFNEQQMPTNQIFDSTKRVRIYNPDYHKVSKGEKVGYQAITSDLTQAEKTRIIAERLFLIIRKLKISEDQEAKILIVFEEAHSLIPEWNSTANEGDRSASNGTAKVILQGRKYGLGCIVVTQRTANISKSILNQCNTIFAMRVFDDTGKQFLQNYIGADYSNTLPTLEERHAIVVGKALKLKQPVIIQLNDKNKIILNNSNNTHNL